MKNKNGWHSEPSAAEEKIAAVLGMDDDRLRAVVRAVAQAGGMSERSAAALTGDADTLRRKLSSVRAEDLQKMQSQISPEQMAALTEQMQKLKQKND